MPIMETIRARLSVRTYVDKPLSKEAETALEARLSELSREHGVTLTLLTNAYKNRKFGTYGIIKNPAAYIACACPNTTDGLLRAGRAGEWAVLACTELGLGTCWLGGTFKREAFGAALKMTEGDLLPAVISVGTPGRERLLSNVMRLGAKSDQRLPAKELFFEGGLARPLQPSGDAQARALEAVRLGPSASNKQPWRVVKDGSGLHFYLAHTPGYAKAMAFDMQVLDMGIAMAHYEAVMREAGQDGRWRKADPEIPGIPGDVEYMMTWVETKEESVDEGSKDEMPMDEALADEMLVEEGDDPTAVTPMDEEPVDDDAVDEASGDGTALDEGSVNGAPLDKGSVDDDAANEAAQGNPARRTKRMRGKSSRGRRTE